MTLGLRDRAALALAAVAAVLVGASGWLLLASGSTEPEGSAFVAASTLPDAVASAGDSTSTLVVDVEGAVVRPGVVMLPRDSRVADAIGAAGGYASDADLAAAAVSLNLAARLTDGAQVYVPILGTSGGTGEVAAESGLVNLNTASLGELEALPGIGPVTAEKIVAARGEQPFATLDELVDRKVMNRGQLDGIRPLVTI